jgi:hypothetical protein
MISRVEYLLQYSGFPDFKKLDYNKNYPILSSYLDNPKPLHFKCSSLIMRKVAKYVALSFAIDFITKNKSKYPPYYIQKFQFVEVCIQSPSFSLNKQIETWKEGSIIVFDGFDEASNSFEMGYISTFISNLILKKTPLILISNGNLNEELLKKYNAFSFGSLILDIEEIIFG